MHKNLIIIILIGIFNMGAISFKVANGFEYDADLKIYRNDELRKIKPGIFEDSDVNSTNRINYLYGWIRLKSWPNNPVTIIPKCVLKVSNDDFNISLQLYALNEEKAEILIPLGTSIKSKEFKIQIK